MAGMSDLSYRNKYAVHDYALANFTDRLYIGVSELVDETNLR